MDRLTDYDYELPSELIASHPAERRDGARMLVVHRGDERWEHRTVRDLPEYLRPGDCLVLNDTRVIPARLNGFREATGGRWEGLFLSVTPAGTWRLLSQSRGRLLEGEVVVVVAPESAATNGNGNGRRLRLTLFAREPDGIFVFRPETPEPWLELLEHFGSVPLPPYIRRETWNQADRERYQTTYARHPGSVAAPTAGLHFTPELLADCVAAGAIVANVTLHVGLGTFRPVSAERLSDHRMHSEWCAVSHATAETVRETRARGGRVLPIGTTSVRTLESAARDGVLGPWEGETNLFIRPPWEFRTIDALLTNFHLPKSTLLILISALAGRDLVLAAYRAAIEEQYRFFSYGDAMLIL